MTAVRPLDMPLDLGQILGQPLARGRRDDRVQRAVQDERRRLHPRRELTQVLDLVPQGTLPRSERKTQRVFDHRRL